MKAQYLDRVIAAGREARSVALATDLGSGAQLLLDNDRFDGELEGFGSEVIALMAREGRI